MNSKLFDCKINVHKNKKKLLEYKFNNSAYQMLIIFEKTKITVFHLFIKYAKSIRQKIIKVILKTFIFA